MTAIEEAREARDEARNHVEHFALSEGDAIRVTRLADVIDALIAEYEGLLREMHQRELHHFEAEKMLSEAGIDPDIPPSDDDERDLAQALFRTLYDAGVSFQSNDLIPRLTATVRTAGFRRQGPPSDDEREALTRILLGVHLDTPLRDWAPRVIDARQIAERVIAAGFRRQGPITDEAVEAATIAALDAVQPTWRATGEAPSADDLAFARAALEAAERVRSAAPSTTEQESNR